ncbi:ArsR/SmtB family transcription factor [Nakamurella deserti]|uniref:ArsR/SmtB family transcription factor n=1 Tax=Nakamurella deserti TaxID=2164074 RepID=UPI001F0BE8FC|nr:metalloregulator ArsR/SmtB family transcription factor [Nakamurella deserti]
MVVQAGFEALADPTRRRIFETLAEAPHSVGSLAALMPVSRPAVSQHLRVLRDAGLVSATARGTRRIDAVDLAGVGALRAYSDRFWTAALADFAATVIADTPGAAAGGSAAVRSEEPG